MVRIQITQDISKMGNLLFSAKFYDDDNNIIYPRELKYRGICLYTVDDRFDYTTCIPHHTCLEFFKPYDNKFVITLHRRITDVIYENGKKIDKIHEEMGML